MIDMQAIRRAIDPKAPAEGNVRCPVHDDKSPSLSINVGDSDRLLVKCHAGCEQSAVFDEVRRRAGSLLNGHRFASGTPTEAVYTYCTERGEPIARVVRKDSANGRKTIWQETPDGRGGWHKRGLKGSTPLYRLEVLAAKPDATVVICEGEKAAEAAQRRLGERFVCTSWMGGADTVGRAHLKPLKGRDVIVWPDADEPGAKAAAALVARLSGIASDVRTVRVDDLPPKADAADVTWDADELLARLTAAESDCGAATASPADLPRVLDLAALARTEPEPPRSLLEGGGFPCGEVSLLSSNGGLGKSLLALILGVCLAAGKPFFGLAVQRRRVYFLSLEDPLPVLHWRLHRVCAWLGSDLEKLARDGWLTIADGSHADGELYADTREGAVLTHVYEWLAREMQGREVLILDGISDAYGGDEIRRRQVRAFVRAVRRLVPQHGGALMLGHVNATTARAPETSQGYSGSTAWNNSVRARWYLRPEPDSEDLLLELQKANNAKAGTQIRLRWSEAAHVFVGELSLPAGRLERELAESDEREAVLGLIAEAQASGDPVPAATTGSRTSWSVLRHRADFPARLATPSGKRRFWEHLEKLRAAGRVRVAEHKTEGRKRREVLHAS